MGSMGKFLGSLYFHFQKSVFNHLGAREWLGSAWTSFWPTEWNEKRLFG